MQNYLLYTFEILLVVVIPLLVLYLKGNWPLRKVIPPLVIIPALWYLSYAPVHELSYAAGAFLVGGDVVAYKLIPRFWMGEFAGAWITPAGLTQSWQQLTMTSFPYIVDIVCFVAALFVFRKTSSKNPFLVGLAFMLLCLRPACDFEFEPIALLSGYRFDLYHIQLSIGPIATWLFLLFSVGLAIYAITSSLNHLVRQLKNCFE